jgi:hypothetical protein
VPLLLMPDSPHHPLHRLKSRRRWQQSASKTDCSTWRPHSVHVLSCWVRVCVRYNVMLCACMRACVRYNYALRACVRMCARVRACMHAFLATIISGDGYAAHKSYSDGFVCVAAWLPVGDACLVQELCLVVSCIDDLAQPSDTSCARVAQAAR